MQVEELTRENLGDVLRFLRDLSELDRTFIKDDLGQATVASWATEDQLGRRWVATAEGGTVVGIVAVLPLLEWSSHVGDLRLVVHPAKRGQGVGQVLAKHALQQALRRGLQKVVVEVVATQESAIAMFSGLGFETEAILYDQTSDRQGRLQDVVILAHSVADQYSAMAAVGLDTDLPQP
jgi:ribosomal protein S18 acetylase RimI-like enzyme